MKIGRFIGAALFAAGIVAAGYFVWTEYFETRQPSVLTATVAIGDVEESVLATGTLKPVKLVAVGAQVSGRITAVRVALGQTVTTGDLIAEIDSVTQANALRTAEASLARASAILRALRSNGS